VHRRADAEKIYAEEAKRSAATKEFHNLQGSPGVTWQRWYEKQDMYIGEYADDVLWQVQVRLLPKARTQVRDYSCNRSPIANLVVCFID
jgi:hypothetical protein